MTPRTLGDVKDNLRQIAGQAGFAVDDKRLVETINLVQENLLNKCKSIVGSVHRLRFRQYQGIIALPARYERIIESSINREPAPVMNQWYEFIDYGPGPQDRTTGLNVLIDRGDAPVIRQPAGWKVRLQAYENEDVDGTPQKVRIFGYDENGKWVRTEVSEGVYIDGEEIELKPTTSDGTVRYSRITQVRKPATRDVIDIQYVDEGGEVYFAGRWEHWQKNPSFRLYFAPAISNDAEATIHCLASVRFREVAEDDDPLLIGCLPALRHGVRAVAKENADDPVSADTSWQLAQQAISDESRRYYGYAKPAVQVQEGSGFGRIPDVI